MSIKTSKRIALGVIASLVFAPFAAITPAWAGLGATSLSMKDPVIAMLAGQTNTSSVLRVSTGSAGANGDVLRATMTITSVPNGSALTLDDDATHDGTKATLITAAGGVTDYTNAVGPSAGTTVITTVSNTPAAVTDMTLGTISFTPDVPGTYVLTLTPTQTQTTGTGASGLSAATQTYIVLPSTTDTTAITAVQSQVAGTISQTNTIAVVRNAGSKNTDGQILGQATVSADTTTLPLTTVFGGKTGAVAPITVAGTALAPTFLIDRTNLDAGTYTMRFWLDANSNGAYDNGEVFTTATFTVTGASLTGLGLDAGDFGLAYGATGEGVPANSNIAVTDRGVTYVGNVHEKTPLTRDVVEIKYSVETATALRLNILAAAVTTDDLTNASGRYLTFTISGPATWTLNQTGTGYAAANSDISADSKVMTIRKKATGSFVVPDSLLFNLNGVGKVTITVRDVLASTGVATSIGSYVVHSVDTSVVGVYSAVDSSAQLQITPVPLTAIPDPEIDVVGANTRANTGTAYLALYLADVYDGPVVPAAGRALIATATNGAQVGWGGIPTASTAIETANLYNPILWIRQGTATTTTVEVKLNDTVVTTRTVSWTGAASSIAISAKKASVAAGATTADAFKYAISDAAGTRIASSASVLTVDGVYVTAATVAAGSATAASGVSVTCSALLGKGSVTLLYATTKTEKVDVTCAGGIASFEVSTNKTAFERSEIGVFTITAKDTAGQPVADGTALASAAARLQFTGSGATFAKSPTATDVFTDGKIDYAFTSSATAGSYSLAVWHADLSPAVTKIAAFSVNAAAVAPTYTKPTLTASLENGRVLLFGACEAEEGDMIIYVKSPGKPWNEKAKTLECVAGEFEGSVRAPKSFPKYYRVKQEGTALWSSSVLVRP